MTDDPDQHRDKRQRIEEGNAGNDDAMEMDSSILPSNHDRSVEVKEEEAATPDVMKGEREQTEIGESLDQLQKDMGEPFLLCRSSKALYVQPYSYVIAY